MKEDERRRGSHPPFFNSHSESAFLQSAFRIPQSSLSGSAVVNLVYEAAVCFVYDAALHLERRGKLAAGNREVFGEERDAAHALVVGERRRQLRHVALHELDSLGAAAPGDARRVLFGL